MEKQHTEQSGAIDASGPGILTPQPSSQALKRAHDKFDDEASDEAHDRAVKRIRSGQQPEEDFELPIKATTHATDALLNLRPPVTEASLPGLSITSRNFITKLHKPKKAAKHYWDSNFFKSRQAENDERRRVANWIDELRQPAIPGKPSPLMRYATPPPIDPREMKWYLRPVPKEEATRKKSPRRNRKIRDKKAAKSIFPGTLRAPRAPRKPQSPPPPPPPPPTRPTRIRRQTSKASESTTTNDGITAPVTPTLAPASLPSQPKEVPPKDVQPTDVQSKVVKKEAKASKPSAAPTTPKPKTKKSTTKNTRKTGEVHHSSPKDALLGKIKEYMSARTKDSSNPKSAHMSFNDVQMPTLGTAILTSEVAKYEKDQDKAFILTGDASDLHKKEREMVQALKITYDEYRCQKRRIVLGFALFQTLRLRTPAISDSWSKTQTQAVGNVDVNKLSNFYVNFSNWGWLSMDHYEQAYLDRIVAGFDAWNAPK
jgi:hypothetical protein